MSAHSLESGRPIQHLKRMYPLILLALTLAACSNLAHREVADETVFSKLKTAVAEGDATALPVAVHVLQDVLEQRNTYKSDTFELAFDLVEQLKPRETATLLREIATMSYRQEPGPLQTRQLIAVQRALGVLAEMRDPQTAAISLLLLDADSWLQRVAIESLAKIESWEATPRIVSMLEGMALDKDHLLVAVKALRFLSQSPETKPESCRAISLVVHGYPDCRQPGSKSYCEDLAQIIAQLEDRLECSTL